MPKITVKTLTGKKLADVDDLITVSFMLLLLHLTHIFEV